jgi:hypothetical protein
VTKRFLAQSQKYSPYQSPKTPQQRKPYQLPKHLSILSQVIFLFKALGATGALNLDVGGSTAMIFNGRYVYGPGRKLPNAVVFVKK